ncbi:hypothetical protein BGZ83_007578 [Gryganskiella cystojenkinii]|nr:hypothetical protein BGZ83_007578 [Gryganskiella cystojenkinii]
MRNSAASTIKKTLRSDLSSIVDKARIRCGIPGMSIAILHKSKLIFAEGFGIRNEQQEPFTVETLSPIASLTKSFTATAIGQLVAEGKMDWNKTPIKTYIPEFTLKDTALAAQLTLSDLLSHRTGLTPHVEPVFMQKGATFSEMIPRLQFAETSSSKLGTLSLYNNTMYGIAGEAASRVSGLSYPDLVRQKILEPLGLLNSGLSIDEMISRSPLNHAKPFVAVSLEAAQKGQFSRLPHIIDVETLTACGGMFSDVLDLAKWGDIIMNHGKADGDQQVLDATSVQETLSPKTIIAFKKRSPVMAPVSAYGFGWVLDSYKGQTFYWHNGGLPGVSSSLHMFPDSDLVIASLCNQHCTELGTSLALFLADELLDLPVDTPKKDWIETAEKNGQEIFQMFDEMATGKMTLPERKLDQPLTLSVDSLVGEYSHPLYGTISTHQQENSDQKRQLLIFKVLGKEYSAEHYHGNAFLVRLKFDGIVLATLFEFKIRENGTVASMTESQSLVEYQRN